MSGRIGIAPHGPGALSIRPAEYLGQDFGRYLEATRTAGARYDADKKAQIIAADRLHVAIRALEREGFRVVMDEAVKPVATESLPEIPACEPVGLEEILADCAARGLNPFPFQMTGIRWLATRDRGLLGDQMGLGKTIQALLALPKGAPAVVICPATLKGNWAREARLWRPDITVHVCKGRKGFRWPAQALPGFAAELIVCNFDILPGEIEKPQPGKRRKPPELPPCPAGTVVIVDEAHALKNPRANRTFKFRAMSKAAFEAGGRVWLMTGTAILNHPGELVTVLRAARLDKIAFGSYQDALRLLGGYKTAFGVQWGRPDPRVPELLNRVMLRRSRAAVLPDLPVKTYQDVEVEIDADTKALCDEALAILRKAGVDLDEAVEEAKVGDVVFETISRIRKQVAIAKIPALLERIEEYEDNDEPVVVFSAHRKPVEALAARPGWSMILGDQSTDERDEAVRAFQAGELKGIALTVRAGGIGITLTRAHHVVLNDLEWTPALNQQAEDRVCRIGQTRGVVVTRLYADHEIDQMINAKLVKKQKLIDQTTEAREYDGGGAVADNHGSSFSAGSPSSEQPPAPSSNNSGCLEPYTPLPPVSSGHGAPSPAGGAPVFNRRFHEAETPMQRWAAATILHVAAMDRDHARMVNGVGFSKLDGDFGHSIADQIRSLGRLSERQWEGAEKLARKYRRQADEPMPDTTEGDPK